MSAFTKICGQKLIDFDSFNALIRNDTVVISDSRWSWGSQQQDDPLSTCPIIWKGLSKLGTVIINTSKVFIIWYNIFMIINNTLVIFTKFPTLFQPPLSQYVACDPVFPSLPACLPLEEMSMIFCRQLGGNVPWDFLLILFIFIHCFLVYFYFLPLLLSPCVFGRK